MRKMSKCVLLDHLKSILNQSIIYTLKNIIKLKKIRSEKKRKYGS
jgi:hypothetical protein